MMDKVIINVSKKKTRWEKSGGTRAATEQQLLWRGGEWLLAMVFVKKVWGRYTKYLWNQQGN